MKNSLLIIVVLIIIFISCEKIRSYPDVPEISPKDYTLSASLDKLGNKIYQLEFSFNFVDGDGDLSSPASPIRGTNDTTTFSKLYWNYFVKKNGIFEPYIITDTSLKNSFFLPWEYFMERQGQNKTLKGTIIQKIQFYKPYPFDTFKIEYYVKDRAYHKSNTIEIPDELILNE